MICKSKVAEVTPGPASVVYRLKKEDERVRQNEGLLWLEREVAREKNSSLENLSKVFFQLFNHIRSETGESEWRDGSESKS